MTDSIKLSEIHRTNIEYERQRHLANWFIKSSPHMAKPVPQAAVVSPIKAQQKLSTKNGGILQQDQQNPLFFLGKVNHVPSGVNLPLSPVPVFNSQSNLPIQSTPIKPKVRRFTSQYSNMFSVDDFENARLARRNELELKQRQLNRYKMNSLSSGGDCSTGDSKGSKFSNESNPELLPADVFLEKFSLPRVVRISAKKEFSDETMQSSSSNGSSSASANSSTGVIQKTTKDMTDTQQPNGELFLLYRYLRNRKIYHGVNAKNGANRKKGVMIPQEFSGYFSLINDKGVPTATLYTTITKLVREKVYKFLSVDNLTAYTESQSTDTFPSRPHYVKGTARGGQVFRLLAVFEDGKTDSSSQSIGVTTFKNGSNAGRYAQLLNENRQVIYVSLTSKGKFYEIEDTNQLQKSHSLDSNANNGIAGAVVKPKQDFADCVHRISNIVAADLELPITIRFIAGQQGTTTGMPENITITKVSQENCVIACPIEEPESRQPLHLRKLNTTPDMRLIKSFLGFENEVKMFSNPNVQNILKYCQLNCDTFVKSVDIEYIPVVKLPTVNGTKHKGDGLKILRPLNFPKLLRREKSLIAHEKEDSIIFLSKNDLENMDNGKDQATNQQENATGGILNEKMKVFQSTKKKWFRNSKSSAKDTAAMDTDLQSKRMSLDRYQDMSKLLQERFGGDVDIEDKDDTRASSEIGVDARRATIDASDLRQKSMSLQEMDVHSDSCSMKPDLVNIDFAGSSENSGPLEMDDDGHMLNFANQKSFITEKLCSEFHVKTKSQSKSSSNLQQLLHFSVPRKMNVSEKRKNSIETNLLDKPIQPLDFTNSIATTSIDDDLPYSSVRDSLVYQPAIDDDAIAMNNNNNNSTSENIYAEICPESGTTGVSSNRYRGVVNVISSNSSNGSGGARSAIRISVGSTNSFEAGPSSLRHTSTSSSLSDNIYNTLK